MTNRVRGETTLVLAGDTYTLATTMDGLAQLSSHLTCGTLQDMYARLIGVEIMATRVGLQYLTVRCETHDGKVIEGRDAGKRAWANYLLTDSTAVQQAFEEVLSAFVRKGDGGDEDVPLPGEAPSPS